MYIFTGYYTVRVNKIEKEIITLIFDRYNGKHKQHFRLSILQLEI